jgi:Flp pilus assembly protein TadB
VRKSKSWDIGDGDGMKYSKKIGLIDIFTILVGLCAWLYFGSWMLFIVAVITVLLPWIIPILKERRIGEKDGK